MLLNQPGYEVNSGGVSVTLVCDLSGLKKIRRMGDREVIVFGWILVDYANKTQ